MDGELDLPLGIVCMAVLLLALGAKYILKMILIGYRMSKLTLGLLTVCSTQYCNGGRSLSLYIERVSKYILVVGHDELVASSLSVIMLGVKASSKLTDPYKIENKWIEIVWLRISSY